MPLYGPQFPEDDDRDDSEPSVKDASQIYPLRTRLVEVARAACIQAVQDALPRLRMLAEVSSVAEVGAQTLGRLYDKINMATTEDITNYQEGDGVILPYHDLPPLDGSQIQGWPYFEQLDHPSIDAVGPISESQGSYHDRLETFMYDFGTGAGL